MLEICLGRGSRPFFHFLKEVTVQDYLFGVFLIPL